MTIPSIEEALKYLGLTLQDIHHYHGRDGALTVVTNDARKFRVSQADVEAGPPAIMPELPTPAPNLPTITPGADNILTALRARPSQRKRIRPRE